jgi:hypothetical protein
MDVLKSYNISGTVVVNNNPLPGVSIESNDNKTYSDVKGRFNIKGTYTEIFPLFFSRENYESKSIISFDSNDNPITDLGIIELIPLKNSLNQNISDNKTLPDSSLKQLTSVNTTFESIQQKKLNNLLKDLQIRLLPYAITLVAEFGVTNLEKILNKGEKYIKICPSNINNIVNKKNKLVKQLNNIYTTLENITFSLGLTADLLIALEVAFNVIPLIPVPSPPSPSIIAGKLDEQIKKYKNITIGTLVVLTVIKSILLYILNILSFLDNLIFECSQEQGVELINDININSQLLNLQQQPLATSTPIQNEINGFILGVETENTNSTLKRKRAFAKNSQGVKLLLGEWSYSSIEQILIDELIFYIQINNLKAN